MSKRGGFTLKQAVSAAAVMALAASGLITGMAHAADDSTITYGNITGTTGTLTVHKYESGSLDTKPGTPEVDPASAAQATVPGDGLVGITFTAHQINVDLKTNDGWKAISALTSVPAGACTDTGEANFGVLGNGLSSKNNTSFTQKTTAGGVATFSDLPVGAYLVCEKKLEDNETATNKAGKAVSVVKRSAPFIVTVPRPQEDGNNGKGWIYDVHAYPKNTVTETPIKAVTVADDKWLIGTEKALTYTITNKIPSLLDEHFAHYAVIDHHSPELTDVAVETVTVGGAPVTAIADYTLDQVNDSFLVINFTKAGLLKLENKKNTDVVVTLSAKVSSIPVGKTQDDKGLVSNTAYVSVKTSPSIPQDDPDTPVTPDPNNGGAPKPKDSNEPKPKPSNTAKTTWGDVKIRKHDAASPTTGLEGAVFEVYKPENDRNCEVAAGSANRYTPVAGDPITAVTTSANGEIVVSGLYIGKADNGDPAKTRCYVLREKTQPAGYVLPEQDKRTFAVIVNAGVSDAADLDVPNTKVSVPALPLTGASGRVLLMLGGAVLVLASLGFALISRKRKAQA